MTVKILVATQSGTAELCAQEMADQLRGRGYEAEVLMMGDFGTEIFAGGGAFIICTSTYGEGDIPDNGASLYEALVTEKPDLSGVSFAVFGLGDSSYEETFNFGGKKFDEALEVAGATRIVARHVFDADTGNFAEDEVTDWLDGWMKAHPAD